MQSYVLSRVRDAQYKYNSMHHVKRFNRIVREVCRMLKLGYICISIKTDRMKRLFTLLLAPVLAVSLHAQTPPSLQPSQSELSNPLVSAMVEDSAGNIWIGTRRGLNRYNGSSFKVYYQQESGGLVNDYISCLCADTDARIWIGTSSGVSLIKDGKVVPLPATGSGIVESIAVRDEGHIIFSTRDGLFLADKQTMSPTPVYLDSRLTYNRFIQTSDRKVWIRNLSSDVITVLDADFRILKEFHVEGGIHMAAEAPDGSVYVCTGHGIKCYGTDGTPAAMPETLRYAAEGKDVLFLARKGDTAFFGIRDEGVFWLRQGVLVREWEDEDLADDASCAALLTDDNLWLSENGRGLTNLYRHVDRNSMPIPSAYGTDALNMFYSIGGGYLLIITNKGVFRQHLATSEWKALSGQGIEGTDKLGITLRDKRGRLWILSNYNELRRYSLDGDRLELEARWPVEASNSIWDDAAGNVYLLQDDRILRFSPEGVQSDLPGSAHPAFWFCGQTSSGRPYFLADEDIWLLDDSFRFVQAGTGIPSPTCLWEDPKGSWWVGTRNNGVYRRSSDGSIRKIDLGGTGADTNIRSIVGDGEGTVWASSRFDYIRITGDGDNILVLNNPRGETITNNTNSACITENGTAVFGTHARFFFFHKNDSFPEDDIPLFLDGIIVNGETIMDKPDGPLVLKHETRQLAFYFSGKNFNPGIKPTYQYKLEGYDPDWVYPGPALRAGYSGLEKGRYTFRVRVQRSDGSWNTSELAQQVRIKPSPWASWPMQVLYILLLAGLGIFAIRQIIRFRMNREKLELTEQERALSEQISQERTTFFTNVSHEFRTPLSLIYGPVKELARSESLGDKERELVGIVERNSERMVRLTDQLLHFSRSRDTLDSLSIMRTDLSVLLRKMLENFEYMFSQKDLRITTHIPSDLVAYCDREKVERIVFNLLSNAVKYTPAHGEITVSAKAGDGKASITVADTGIGISPDKMTRIFERYERVGESVGGSLPTGFGIGLNYAQHLAHLHNGQITVRANDPIGSVFSFSFPCGKEAYEASNIWQEESGEPKPADTQAAEENEQKGIHILVVEDNPDMREYIKGFLREEYDVTIAGDGEEAWKCIRISVPDLIISDVMMPYKDGYTLCKEIKTDPEFCHIPIILLTAKADMENQIHGLDLGADGYMGKPFDPAYLTALVRNLVAGRRRLQGLLADRTSSSEEPVEDAGLSQQDKAFLDKCYRIIDTHIDDETFGVIGLSMEMGMSRTSIFSKIKALTGQSPQAFLTNYRLNRAMELLKTRDFNISEVAYKVGFATLTGFSRSFKNKFGIPPSAV